MSAAEYTRRWQRAAYQALGEFLKADLPAVTWTIATSGAMTAEVDSLTSTPAEQRAAFDAWVRQLRATVRPERTDSDGVIRLNAVFAWSKNPDVRGAIRASIYPPLDDEAQP